jgi:hypothetical protein
MLGTPRIGRSDSLEAERISKIGCVNGWEAQEAVFG